MEGLKCHLLAEDAILVLEQKGSDVIKYPYVWLRDSCLCESCFNSVTCSRKTRLEDLNLNITIKSAIIKNDNEVVITWEDDHVTTFPISWLLDRQFPSSEKPVARQNRYRNKPRLWGAEMQDHLPTFDFEKLMSDDQFLYDWIVNLDQIGVCIITSSPKSPGQIAKLASRIAFLRPSNYGTVFEVKSKLSPSNAAYTSIALDLHTDLPHYHQPPGTQLLHCIIQAGQGDGGESVVTDGFYAANQLKEQHPGYYRLLCKTQLDFYDMGDDAYGKFHQLYHGPVFTLGPTGEIDRINYSVHCRDSYMGDVQLDQVTTVYKALQTYDNMLRASSVTYLLKPGEILVVDNRRVMHARKAFTMTPGGERFLEAAYIDWDQLYSRMRVLSPSRITDAVYNNVL